MRIDDSVSNLEDRYNRRMDYVWRRTAVDRLRSTSISDSHHWHDCDRDEQEAVEEEEEEER